jgi:hypothetical protein
LKKPSKETIISDIYLSTPPSYGIMYWPNGEKTYGYWQNNFLHGTAIFTEAPDGKRYEEKWKNGNREGARFPLKRTGKFLHPCPSSSSPFIWEAMTDLHTT